MVNPSTPTDLAVRLIGLLQLPELRQVATEGALSEIVRSAARRRMPSD